MTGPLWDGTGVDPWLPQRLAHESRLTLAEQRMYSAWWGSFSDWLVRVKRGVLAGPAPDPNAVWAQSPAWADNMEEFVAGPVTEAVGLAYNALFGPDYAYDQRPAVTRYLAQVHNRMVRTPDDVFDVVASAIARGAGAGESIPTIAARVEDILTATGTDLWRGRAVTVARTETIGALNMGRGEAFAEVAETLGGEFETVWVAALDSRTRPEHSAADGQAVALGEPFLVGGEPLMYPGDPFGSAAMIVNCRCSTILNQVGETTDRTGRGFTDADEWWADQLAEAE